MTQTILVTGANRGIGLEHVRQALAAGQFVIAACRSPEKAGELDQLHQRFPERLRIEQLDTGGAASIAALASRLDGTPIDILINNAGLYGGGWDDSAARQTLAGMDYEQWEEILRVNVIGVFRLTAALLPNLKLSERKLVVMMSSDLGSIANNKQGQSHAYRSSKAALNMLTKGLSVDLREQGVTVMSMAPGWTQTDLGGANAPWPVDESVRRQRAVLAEMTLARGGEFLNLKGETVPW
ncbi:SDR family oxidoreductase [Caulobacter sp. BP25]|uniref:SDR family oxidoreductase n=1 Tax=Caulobacter sp. BP25 TaxID=2048900 RepID=UPI000C12B47D|nr:SDR family oxidoreductase [Caulobacter sp. BP25]PHY19747.1 short-chain dehydrogenase [Caulobacter sp. BP25]